MTRTPTQLVDTDVHPYPRSFDELRTYLPEPIRSQGWLDSFAPGRQSMIYVPAAPNAGMRADAFGPDGAIPGSDPDFASRELFGERGIDYAILNPVPFAPMANPEHEAALYSASNAWLAERWLAEGNGHGRYRGSIGVCSSRPDLAVREIERWAGHPHFVQVMLIPHTRAPLGQVQYHPIYEAAERHGLPVGIHINRSPGLHLLTPVGFVSYYFEHHPLYALIYAPHLVSFIVEGVFDKFPGLKLVLAEGGAAWAGPLLRRLDALWERFGAAETPHLQRRPSSFLRDHVRFTTQPIEEPPDPRSLHRYLEWVDAEHTVMFSTDYPHWDFDDPLQVRRRIPQAMRQRVFCDNAVELYGLPRDAPAPLEVAG